MFIWYKLQNEKNKKLRATIEINSLKYNPIKWSNTLNYLGVFDHFVELALKGLRIMLKIHDGNENI